MGLHPRDVWIREMVWAEHTPDLDQVDPMLFFAPKKHNSTKEHTTPGEGQRRHGHLANDPTSWIPTLVERHIH